MQLVLVESAWIAFLAAAIGAFFAWWSAPFVVSRINPPDNPARLFLPTDWRVLGFGLALTLGVTFLLVWRLRYVPRQSNRQARSKAARTRARGGA